MNILRLSLYDSLNHCWLCGVREDDGQLAIRWVSETEVIQLGHDTNSETSALADRA